MKLNSINELDVKIENIIKKTVKHYLSDWIEYDAPKYWQYKGSKERDDKSLILIVRECGTNLLRVCDVFSKEDTSAKMLYGYYKLNDSTAKYYEVDLNDISIKKLKFD